MQQVTLRGALPLAANLWTEGCYNFGSTLMTRPLTVDENPTASVR
jgi:hypothetical protein